MDADSKGPVGDERNVATVLDHTEGCAGFDHPIDTGGGYRPGDGCHRPNAGFRGSSHHAADDRVVFTGIAGLETHKKKGVTCCRSFDRRPGIEHRLFRREEVRLLFSKERGVRLSMMKTLTNHQSCSDRA